MEFNGPVKVTGTTSNVNVRLALGKDDTRPPRDIRKILRVNNNSLLPRRPRRCASSTTVGNSNNCSLTPQHGDCDPDGLFVHFRR